MINQYVVIKEYPGLALGDVLERQNKSESFVSHRKIGVYHSLMIHESILMANDRYFQPIEEKEFTASDMNNYREWYTSRHRLDGSVQAWKEDVGSKTDVEDEEQ